MHNRQEALLDDFKNLSEQIEELTDAVIGLSTNKTAADYLIDAHKNTVQARAEIMFELREYGYTDFDSIMGRVLLNGKT